MKAISVRQPWAWLIVNGYKDIENRMWTTKHRGHILIHAGWLWYKGYEPETETGLANLKKLFESANIAWPGLEAFERGGIIGQVKITDCITDSNSRWAIAGQKHFILADAKVLPYQAVRGKPGLFEVVLEEGESNNKAN